MSRLADFIEANREAILTEWEEFARSCLPASEAMTVLDLRDHAADILEAIALDLREYQGAVEQHEKSQGRGERVLRGVLTAAEIHGDLRAASGFSADQTISEFRALRASVLRLWAEAIREAAAADLLDITRFNEAIDQALAESMTRFSQQIEESMNLFLARLAHDLRTPLSVVTMFASHLMTPGSSPEEYASSASVILRNGIQMNRIIGDLVDFTRTRFGRSGFHIDPAQMDMEDVCRQVVDEIAAANPRSDVRLHARGALAGSWDVVRIARMVTNLLDNAVEYGSPVDPILLTVDGEGEWVTLALHNRGVVVPAEQIDRIFGPTVPRNVGDSVTHVGLGLFIAKEIAIAHGGRITVDSSEERGTTFTVRLPRCAP